MDNLSICDVRGLPGLLVVLPVFVVLTRVVAKDIRSVGVICLVKWALCQAHSNWRAAILEGNPATIQAISHGRSDALEVRTAPP